MLQLLVVFFTKKKVIFFVLRVKVKKIKKMKKMPLFAFPHKAWGGVYYATPCNLLQFSQFLLLTLHVGFLLKSSRSLIVFFSQRIYCVKKKTKNQNFYFLLFKAQLPIGFFPHRVFFYCRVWSLFGDNAPPKNNVSQKNYSKTNSSQKVTKLCSLISLFSVGKGN